MKKIITFFIKYPVMVNLGMILFVIFGFFGYKSLKSSFFPEASVQFIFVETVYLGASPEEIEEGIVLKIEDNLKGISGIDRVTSVSNENRALITVELETNANLNQVFEDVENAVDRISSFPDQMEPPVIYKQEVVNFASSFAISGDVGLKELKKYARKVENDMRAVPGISKVILDGFPEEEIEVSLRENDMRAYQITFEEVSQAVRNANLEVTGGTIKGSHEEMSIRAKTKQYYAEGLMDIVVKSNADGKVVRIRDLAEVKDQWEDSPAQSYINGQRSVTVTVNTTRDEDILSAADYINNYIEAFNQENQVVQATLIRDGTVPLVQRIQVLTKNGLIGAMLVFLLLAVFLNLRLAFWVALGIPLSFLGMFIIAPAYDLTINILSLFGMIVVIGILVDDGVVVGESIFQEAERGKKPLQAAIDGTMKVMPPVIMAILTTMVAFSLFFFLDGILGEYFSDIAFVVIVTLGISVIEVATFLPSHLAHSWALRGGFKSNKFERYMDGVMIGMRDRLYAPVLRFVLHHKAFSLMVALSFFVLSIGAIRGGLVKTTFFPNIDSDNILVSLEMAPGSNERLTKEQLDIIEAAAWQVNEDFTERRTDDNQTILKVEKKVGPMSHQGSLNIVMLDGETRGVRSLEIQEAFRKQVGDVPEAKKLSYSAFTPFGKPVSISLSSSDFSELESAKNALKEALAELPELRDVIDNEQEGLREVKLELKEKAKLIGLNLQQVIGQVRQGFYGVEVQRLQRGEDEVKVWVRYDQADRSAISKLEDMRIRVPGGASYPLSEVADFRLDKGVIAINHQDGKREIRVEADISSNDVSTT
ncbi:MAG: efflux RND transporter permease subunit, partial [Cyclobacteriaceae bacterium]